MAAAGNTAAFDIIGTTPIVHPIQCTTVLFSHAVDVRNLVVLRGAVLIVIVGCCI